MADPPDAEGEALATLTRLQAGRTSADASPFLHDLAALGAAELPRPASASGVSTAVAGASIPRPASVSVLECGNHSGQRLSTSLGGDSRPDRLVAGLPGQVLASTVIDHQNYLSTCFASLISRILQMPH